MGVSNCNTGVAEIVAKRALLALINANVTCLGETIPAVATDAAYVEGCPSLSTISWTLAKQTSDALCGLQEQITDFVSGEQFLTEVHFSATSDGEVGNGTFDNPYRYASQVAFDAQVNALPAGTAIVLEAGTFITKGLVLKDYQVLKGRGRGITTLKLADNTATVGLSISPIFGGYNLNRVEVYDLTIDNNFANQPMVLTSAAGDINGVQIVATRGRIERVDVEGVYANPGEAFPVSINAQTVSTATNPAIGVIRDVKVRNPIGYLTAISVFNQTAGAGYANEHTVGTIEGCQVVSDDPSGSIGFGAGGWDKMVVRNNYTNNLYCFMVHDTHAGRDVEISSNRSAELGTGSVLQAPVSAFILANGNNANQYLNYRILNNVSEIAAGAETNTQHLTLTFLDNTTLQVVGNVFDSGTAPTGGSFFAFNINAPNGIIRDNWISSNLSIESGVSPAGANLIVSGNRYFDGHPMRDFTVPNKWTETWYRQADRVGAGVVAVNLGEFPALTGAQLLINAALVGANIVGDSQTISVSIRQTGEINVRVLSHARDIVAAFNKPLLQSQLNGATGLYALFLTYDIANSGGIRASISGTPLAPSSVAYSGVFVDYSTYDALVAPPRSMMTIAAGAGAGVGATVSIDGNSVCGFITVLAAGVPAAGGIIGTASFGTGGNWPTGLGPQVLFSPANLAAADHAASGSVWQSAGPNTGFAFNAPTAPLVAASTYIWRYQCGWKFNT